MTGTHDVTGDTMRERISSDMARLRTELARLVSIPSVSSGAIEQREAAAQEVYALLHGAGLDAEIVRVGGCGSAPAVLATRAAARADAPTVLLYAHYDVQPFGSRESWASDPLTVLEREGRLYGRGTADDKAAVVMHVAAIRAHGHDLPVNVTVLVEGEEELGSPHMDPLLDACGERLKADAAIVADAQNHRPGRPALTVSLRGFVDFVLELRTAGHGVHSGMYGGVIPDSLSCLCRALSSLLDESGNVAVSGLVSRSFEPLDLTESELRTRAGACEGVQLLGSGSVTERLWAKPAVSISAIDCARVAEASPQLVPFARALIDVRIAPGDDAEEAFEKVRRHLLGHVPWGADAEVTDLSLGQPLLVRTDGPAHQAMHRAMAEAWGLPAVEIGSGASIPLAGALMQRFPDLQMLITAVADPASNTHAENESLDLGDFEKACLAEAMFLSYFGKTIAGSGGLVQRRPHD